MRRGSVRCCAVRVEQRPELRSGSGSERKGVVSMRWTLLCATSGMEEPQDGMRSVLCELLDWPAPQHGNGGPQGGLQLGVRVGLGDEPERLGCLRPVQGGRVGMGAQIE